MEGLRLLDEAQHAGGGAETSPASAKNKDKKERGRRRRFLTLKHYALHVVDRSSPDR